MNLLIVTQTVDAKDPTLGFFHRWIEEFAKNCEQVEVICLNEGNHTLPSNVRVHSLGKEKTAMMHHSGLKRPIYSLKFLSLVWKFRRKYDAVFVHMNPEYLVIAGWLWKLLGKRTALWYTHKQVDMKLRAGVIFADAVFTASPGSFRLQSKKRIVTGHGIDTDFFTPDEQIPRETHLLSVGRLMKSKRHDLAIRAAATSGRSLNIAGEGSERGSLEALARELDAQVTFLGGISQEQLRDAYRRAAFLLHTSETGSLDKVVLEALACDCAVITTARDAYAHFPVRSVEATPEAIAQAVESERESLDRASIIRSEHSLSRLIERIIAWYIHL